MAPVLVARAWVMTPPDRLSSCDAGGSLSRRCLLDAGRRKAVTGAWGAKTVTALATMDGPMMGGPG
jgi:hypothetical protein